MFPIIIALFIFSGVALVQWLSTQQKLAESRQKAEELRQSNDTLQHNVKQLEQSLQHAQKNNQTLSQEKEGLSAQNSSLHHKKNMGNNFLKGYSLEIQCLMALANIAMNSQGSLFHTNHIFFNVNLPKQAGKTAQLDMVVNSPRGMVLIECKNWNFHQNYTLEDKYHNILMKSDDGTEISNPIMEVQANSETLYAALNTSTDIKRVLVFSDAFYEKYGRGIQNILDKGREKERKLFFTQISNIQNLEKCLQSLLKTPVQDPTQLEENQRFLSKHSSWILPDL